MGPRHKDKIELYETDERHASRPTGTFVWKRWRPSRASWLSRDRGGIQQPEVKFKPRTPPSPTTTCAFTAAVWLSFKRPRAISAASTGGQSRLVVRWVRVGCSRWRVRGWCSCESCSEMALLRREKWYQNLSASNSSWWQKCEEIFYNKIIRYRYRYHYHSLIKKRKKNNSTEIMLSILFNSVAEPPLFWAAGGSRRLRLLILNFFKPALKNVIINKNHFWFIPVLSL